MIVNLTQKTFWIVVLIGIVGWYLWKKIRVGNTAVYSKLNFSTQKALMNAGRQLYVKVGTIEYLSG